MNKGLAFLGGLTGLLYFLSASYRGPERAKYEIPPKTFERMKQLGIPEVEAMWRPDTHPALSKNQSHQN